jgi:hypothetical protein
MDTTTIQKGIIFFGAAGSGKTKLALEIASAYSESERVFIDTSHWYSDTGFNFSACTPETKLIICDDVIRRSVFEQIAYLQFSGITVYRKMEIPFKIIPRIIITLSEKFNLNDAVFFSFFIKRRNDIVVINP